MTTDYPNASIHYCAFLDMSSHLLSRLTFQNEAMKVTSCSQKRKSISWKIS